MASVLAIVSKALFEAAGGLRPGDRFDADGYASAHPGLAPLGAGGDLYLVTARPGDVLWLVGILRAPTFDGARWSAAPNTTPIRDLTPLIPALRFATGKGLRPKPGALGMSLQTPRALTPEDVALIEGGTPPGEATGPEPAPSDARAQLAAALETWRRTPWRELVPAAVALSELVESPAARALRAGEGPVPDEAWDAVFAAGRPEDAGALFETFHRAPLASLLVRVRSVAALGPDPRLAHLVHRLLRVPPFRATSSQPVWNALFDAVLAHPDPETLAVVREVAATPFPSGAAFQKWIATKLAAVEKKLVAAGVEAVVAPPADAARWSALAGAPAPAPTPAPPASRAPAAFPAAGAPVEAVAAPGGTARALVRSPAGRWVAAWVADPSESTTQPVVRTAALVSLDVRDGRVLGTVPLREAGFRVYAVGHAPGAFAVAEGPRVRLVGPAGERHLDGLAVGAVPPAGDDGLAPSPFLALAFGPDDAELFALVQVNQRSNGPRPEADQAWRVVDLASGAVREVALCPDGRREDACATLATATHLVSGAGRQLRVWDRRWGAWSLAEDLDWPRAQVSGGASVLLVREKGWRRVDLATGASVGGEGAAADLLDDGLLLGASLAPRGSGVVGPLRVLGPDGRLRRTVARADGDAGPACLVEGGVLVVDEDGAVLHRDPTQTRLRWCAGRADAIAARGGAVAVAAGSRVVLRRAGAERIHAEDHPIRAAALAADGQVAWLAVAKSVRVVPLGTGKARSLAGHAYPVTCLAVASDGAVASGSEDHLVIVWEPGGALRRKLAGHPGAVLGVAFDPSGARLASVGADGVVRVFDPASGALTAELPAPGATGPIAYGADGTLAWLDQDGLALGDAARRVSLPGATALASHADRPLFAAATADGAVHAVLPDGATRVLSRGHRPAPMALAFDGDALHVGAPPAEVAATSCVLPLTWEVR
jgi:hypothetical protein